MGVASSVNDVSGVNRVLSSWWGWWILVRCVTVFLLAPKVAAEPDPAHNVMVWMVWIKHLYM